MNAIVITTRYSYSEPAVADAASTRARAVHTAVRRTASSRFANDKHEPMR